MYDKKYAKKDGKKIKAEKPIAKWIVDANITKAELEKACNLLDSGMKVRRVALKFGIHKNKIRRI